MAEPHRELREQLGAFALGQLTGDQWRAVQEHLEVCAACRVDLDEIAPVVGVLERARGGVRTDALDGAEPRDQPPVPPLSPALLAQVRAAASGAAVPVSRRWRWPLLAAAATVVLGVAGGAIGYAVGASSAPNVPLEQVAVRALDPAVQARAAVVPHTWGMEVKLTATGFRPGVVYRVTVTDDAGRVVDAGEFVGTGATEMRCNLNSSVLRADAATVQVFGPGDSIVLDAAV